MTVFPVVSVILNVIELPLIVPSMVLGLSTMAYLTRLMRSSMLEIVNSDYVRTAKSKGIPPTRIFTNHQLRNAILPVITVLGPRTPSRGAGPLRSSRRSRGSNPGAMAYEKVIDEVNVRSKTHIVMFADVCVVDVQNAGRRYR